MTPNSEYIQAIARFFHTFDNLTEYPQLNEYLALEVYFPIENLNGPDKFKVHVQKVNGVATAMAFLTKDEAQTLQRTQFPLNPIRKGTLGEFISKTQTIVPEMFVTNLFSGLVMVDRIRISPDAQAIVKVIQAFAGENPIAELSEVTFPEKTAIGTFSPADIPEDKRARIHAVMEEEGLDVGYTIEFFDPIDVDPKKLSGDLEIAVRVKAYRFGEEGSVDRMIDLDARLRAIDPNTRLRPDYGVTRELPYRSM